MKLYLDENLSPRVADKLRADSLDVVSAYEVGNVQLDDRAQLRYAAREGRAIVTCDVADFVELAAEAVAENASHAGIILVPSSFRTDEVEAIADGIERVVQQYPAGLLETVVYLNRASESSGSGRVPTIDRVARGDPRPVPAPRARRYVRCTAHGSEMSREWYGSIPVTRSA